MWLVSKKHNKSQYIGVDVLDFGEIPNFMQQLSSLFKSQPVNSDIICEHGLTPFTPNKQKILFQKRNGKRYHYYLVTEMYEIKNCLM